MKNLKQALKYGSGLGVLALTNAAFAVDVTAITTEMADVATKVATVGAAVILVYLGIKAFKMIKQAF